ncbi:MAG: hypothetical protein U0132_17580 [Gemmatimonadaceae bacterium]
MKLPDKINGAWVMGLANDDLVEAEWQLHQLFTKLEVSEKKAMGSKYEMLRGSAELIMAWQRWGLVSSAVRSRGLHPRYRGKTA